MHKVRINSFLQKIILNVQYSWNEILNSLYSIFISKFEEHAIKSLESSLVPFQKVQHLKKFVLIEF